MIVTDTRLGEMLVEWAANLRPAEKAEANANLVRWCEVHETKKASSR